MLLSFKDIYPYLASLPHPDKVTLIGGQALNFWAELYFHNDPLLYQQHAPFTSKDVDFLGLPEAVLECANAWQMEAELAPPFDTAPDTGLIIIPLGAEEKLIVNFLAFAHGVDNAELKTQRLKMRFKNAEIYIMHPLHCLQSRISNVIGLYRQEPHSIRQLNTAVAVVKKRLLNLLDRGEIRQTLKEIEWVFRLACNRLGLRIFVYHHIDIFEAIPDDNRCGEAFLKKRYPQMQVILADKRNRLATLRNRRQHT